MCWWLVIFVVVVGILVLAFAFSNIGLSPKIYWVGSSGAPAAFLDFGHAPRLTFYHSRDSVPSQKFEVEWELLKQRANLAYLNVDFRLIDVDAVGALHRKAIVPAVEFARDPKPHGQPGESYRGQLTSDALLGFLRERLGCV